jgi:hypothetical protein
VDKKLLKLDKNIYFKKMNSLKGKTMNEEKVLLSLDNAISSYSQSDFDHILEADYGNSNHTEVIHSEDQDAVLDKVSVKKSKKTPKTKNKKIENVLINNETEEESIVKPLKTSFTKEVTSDFKELKKKLVKSRKIPKVKTSKVTLKKTLKHSKVNENTTKKGKKFRYPAFLTKYNKQIFTVSLSLLMFGFVTFSSYIAYAYVSAPSQDVVSSVGKHIILPTGETPKVYIIQSDKSEAFQNPVFKGIEVGDNVLNYEKAGKVIIYRSKEDKIVNIVSTGNQ